jgi:adenosylcobinamide-GDP ribazoletransferase
MNAWIEDIRNAIAFLTRIPMPHPDGAVPRHFSRCCRVFPLVGAAIGSAVAAVDLGLLAIGLPGLAAAALALGASASVTGALHEDGLADVADGFGGGRDKAAKLEIMRDSRLGTYGALILLVSFAAKAASLAALARADVVPGLIAAHALARAPLAAMAAAMPYARPDGLASAAGRPTGTTAAISVVLGLIIAFVALPWAKAAAAACVVAIGSLCLAVLAIRQVGGQTGDVLGGTEQINETAVLLLLAADIA